MPIEMDSLGNEAAIQVSISWDPAILNSPVVSVGSGMRDLRKMTHSPVMVLAEGGWVGEAVRLGRILAVARDNGEGIRPRE